MPSAQGCTRLHKADSAAGSQASCLRYSDAPVRVKPFQMQQLT